MNSITQTMILQDLLKAYKSESLPVLLNINPGSKTNSYLHEKVIRKVIADQKNSIVYHNISGLKADMIKSELQIPKHPIVALIFQGQIEMIHSGIIGSQQLQKAIKQIISKKQPARNWSERITSISHNNKNLETWKITFYSSS